MAFPMGVRAGGRSLNRRIRSMPRLVLPILFVAGLAGGMPALAQNNLGDIVSGVAQSLIAQELEQNAFREAQRLNTESAYRGYLRQFPRGSQRLAAERALAQIGAAVAGGTATLPPAQTVPASAASVEADIGLTRTQRTQIQTQLSALGYASGVADGLWGSNTRNALRRWQTANNVTSTGYVTAQQVGLIRQQAGTAAGNAAPVDPVAQDDVVEERLLGLTLAERREIQRRLTHLGYNTRGVDGSFGANTRRALSAWQRDEGLRASGYATADQLRELRRQTAG